MPIAFAIGIPAAIGLPLLTTIPLSIAAQRLFRAWIPSRRSSSHSSLGFWS